MRPSLSNFLVLTGGLSLALLAPAHAKSVRGPSGGGDIVVKIVEGQPVARTKCEWHNFFQSMNMWPRYSVCPGKTGHESFGFYASNFMPSSVLNDFLMYNFSQRYSRGKDFVAPAGSILTSFRIGDAWHTASICGWYNLFQSRYRTPYYLNCEGRSNRESFGMYSEPDYLKSGSANEQLTREILPRRAPDVSAFLESSQGAAPLSLWIGTREYKRSFCEWHNFFQSFNPLPRFAICYGKTRDASFAQYEFGQNIIALKANVSPNGDATSKNFGEIVRFKLGEESVTAKRCALYNWLQSNMRWPIYRGCGTIRQDSFSTANPSVFPKADRRYVYNHNYTD